MSNEMDLDALEAELADFAVPEKKVGRSAREERIIAGFEDIQRFFEQHGHAPWHGEGRDIFERLYAVRLERLRQQDECRELLRERDHQGLLTSHGLRQPAQEYSLSDDELLAELADLQSDTDILSLKHVRSAADKREAEEIAQREPCEDFHRFQPLFEQARQELNTGTWQTRPFVNDAAIEQGQFFILGGQTVYVAEKGDEFTTPQGHPDARLRVIYSNGTESNLLLRSLQRALYKDEAGRRLVTPDAMPLFGDTLDADDIESGTVYVLRSMSDHAYVAEHRHLIHKIGVTGGKVETRIANAPNDATYMLAEVEIIATYRLAGINRVKLEQLFHRIFSPARLELTIADRFGRPVRPREWFLVPLHVIDEAVKRVQDGTITAVVYDPATASLRAMK